MRVTFIRTLELLAKKDERVYLLTGDLGFSVFENFRKLFPARFLNCGVAEQNMMGVAAGLALSGKKPYVYSIIPFTTIRCLEQIRNDICYQNLDVKIVGVGGGFTYGPLGSSHHAIEELGILRCLPNMTILSPGDPVETEKLMLESYKTASPTYIRLSRGGDEIMHRKTEKIRIGEPLILKKGNDIAIMVTGSLLKIAKDVAEELEKDGYSCKLISLPTLKPINRKNIIKELKGVKSIFTVEEHNIIGGLGSAMSEILIEEEGCKCLKRIGINDRYPDKIGSMDYLRQQFGLDKEQIKDFILARIPRPLGRG